MERETKSPLNRIGRMYLQSMQENRPQMYQDALEQGKLEELAVAAQEAMAEEVANLILAGWDPALAQSQAIQEILLPDSDQVPDLNQNPFTLPK